MRIVSCSCPRLRRLHRKPDRGPLRVGARPHHAVDLADRMQAHEQRPVRREDRLPHAVPLPPVGAAQRTHCIAPPLQAQHDAAGVGQGPAANDQVAVVQSAGKAPPGPRPARPRSGAGSSPCPATAGGRRWPADRAWPHGTLPARQNRLQRAAPAAGRSGCWPTGHGSWRRGSSGRPPA